MHTLTIEYPSEVLWALQQEPQEFEADVRLLLAVKLYETGRLSTGLAARLVEEEIAVLERNPQIMTDKLCVHGSRPVSTHQTSDSTAGGQRLAIAQLKLTYPRHFLIVHSSFLSSHSLSSIRCDIPTPLALEESCS